MFVADEPEPPHTAAAVAIELGATAGDKPPPAYDDLAVNAEADVGNVHLERFRSLSRQVSAVHAPHTRHMSVNSGEGILGCPTSFKVMLYMCVAFAVCIWLLVVAGYNCAEAYNLNDDIREHFADPEQCNYCYNQSLVMGHDDKSMLFEFEQCYDNNPSYVVPEGSNLLVRLRGWTFAKNRSFVRSLRWQSIFVFFTVLPLTCCILALLMVGVNGDTEEIFQGMLMTGFLIFICCALNGYFTNFVALLVETEPTIEGFSCFVTVSNSSSTYALIWLGFILLFLGICQSGETALISLCCVGGISSLVLWYFNFAIAIALFEQTEEAFPLIVAWCQVLLPIAFCCCICFISIF